MAADTVAKRKKRGSLQKQFMLSAIKLIAEKIVDKKAKSNGRVPWGYAKELLKEGRETFPKMSMRTINNYVIKEEKKRNVISTILVDNSSNNMSSLTDPEFHVTTAAEATLANPDYSSDSSVESSNDTVAIKVGGRPKGTSIANTLDIKKRKAIATNEAIEELAEMQSRARISRERLEKGALTQIILDCTSRHGLSRDSINIESVRQRLKRNTQTSTQGPKSPLHDIEPYVVSLIIQLANMRVPITTAQGLQLCNSIIKGTKYEKDALEFKENYLRSATTSLGRGYWRGFLKRNKHLISSKKAVKFDTKRAEWCTYLNVEEMYNEVYSNLVASRLAVKHNDAIWRNAAGDVVPENESLGCQSAYELIHPEWLVFVDEVGSNTSQTKDGRVGGQTYLCMKEGRPQQRAATKDAHFTVLGFTAANGKPLMCAIIFAAKSLKEEWRLGFNPFVEWIGEEDDVSQNVGEGKAMPEGPECIFEGKRLPCFCCASENGSITGQLLKEMLQAIDATNVFDRTTGLNPFLLLDGHGSRFELDFLTYVNSSETKWDVNIGLPYGTSYWQVGDSSEQNGCFKMALTRAKQELVTKKNDAGLEFAIEKTDVVGLVREAWELSFARVQTNQKAIVSRGWGPRALNYNALRHPEILTSAPGTSVKRPIDALESRALPEELNLSEGLSATLVDRIVIHKNLEASRNGINADEQRRKRRATAQEKLRSQEKRISAGLLAAAGHYQLNDNVRDYVQQKAAAVKQKEYEKHLRKKDEYDALFAQVQAIRLQNLPYNMWTQAHLRTMIKWFKRDGDEKLPSKKSEQIMRYLATCHRGDLPAPMLLDGFAAVVLPPLATAAPVPPVADTAAPVPPVPDTAAPVPPVFETTEEEVARILLAAVNNRVEQVTAAVAASSV
jgi:hypothetical protein